MNGRHIFIVLFQLFYRFANFKSKMIVGGRGKGQEVAERNEVSGVKAKSGPGAVHLGARFTQRTPLGAPAPPLP